MNAQLLQAFDSQGRPVLDGLAIGRLAGVALSELEQLRHSLESSLNDSLAPTLRWEHLVLLRGYDECRQWLSVWGERASHGGREELGQMGQGAQAVADRWQMAMALFSEARDSEMGPTTHAGLNRLIALREQADFENACAHQAQLLELEAQQAWVPEQQPLLMELRARLLGPGPERLEEALEWGGRWLRVDLATFQRRSQWRPFPWPVLNLALNSLWAFEQDQVEQCLTDYFCDQARRELLDKVQGTAGLAEALQNPDLTSADLHRLLSQLQQQGFESMTTTCKVCQLPWPAGQLVCRGCGTRR